MKILIIDDDKDLRDLMQMNLKRDGHDVESFPGVRAGIDAAEAGSPDVIILDVRMPEMDGYDALRLLKDGEKTRDIPVIMLTAADDYDDFKKARDLGAVGYIPKPFNTTNLSDAIEKMLIQG